MNSGIKKPAASFEEASFAQMKPLGCRAQTGAVLACCLGLALLGSHVERSPWAYGWLMVAVLGLTGAWKAKSAGGYFGATAIVMAGCAACAGYLVNESAFPLFWFLPVGLCLTLPGAALYLTPLRFVGIASLIWATLILIIQPGFPLADDRNSALLTVLASTAVGAMGNRSIHRLRKSNFKLQQELHLLAYVDPLTALPNRRAFMERLLSAIDAAMPKQNLHFLMLDIDDFKKINDSLGHDVGDVALITLGKVIRAHAAPHNFARLGGEEFAVVAADLDGDGLHALAHGLVQQASRCDVQGCNFTLSIGVAQHVTGEGATSLMRRADEALYQAKQAGKNRYVMASGGVSAA